MDVSNLNVGESLHVRDLQLPSGVEAVTNGDLTVASVVESRVGEEIEATEAIATEPVVITEKKAEEGKESEAKS